MSEEIVAELTERPESALVENLAGLAVAMIQKVGADQNLPTKVALREELHRISAAVDVLERSLKNVALLELVHSKMEGGLEQVGPMITTLRRYRAAANKVAGQIPSTPGAVRVKVSDNLLDAKAWCALLIRETWFLCRGGTPGDTNHQAQIICERLWAAVTGSTASEKVGRWETHLKRARKCDDWQLEHVREHLNLLPYDFSGVHTESA